LSVTIAPEGRQGSDLVDAYAAQIGDRTWAVGGLAAPELRTQIEARGGHVVHGSVEQQRDQLGRLLSRPRAKA
jgi:hypothetical protein